MAVAP